MRGVYPRRSQTIESDAAKVVGSDQRGELYPRSQGRGIVRHDRRGASQRCTEAAGKQFSFHRHLRWKAVQNKVEIQFPRDRDIKRLHNSRIAPC